MSDTIYAVVTGSQRGAVAVVRLSGPQSGPALEALSGQPLPRSRRAVVRRLGDPATGDRLDQALVLWMPGPGTYTGEDIVELHVHGGRAVVLAVCETLGRLPGLRPATAGEFTRRAVVNGRMDLTAAEAVADVIAAETAAQRRQALGQLEGGLATLYEGWRQGLLRLQALVEAEIDFADEDLPAALAEAAQLAIGTLSRALRQHLGDARRGERLREGFHVVILGPPNAGKSSLLNALARRDAAIVSAISGTTRDVIEVHLDLQGYPVVLADTAGLRDTDCPIEQEGMRRGLARGEAADLRLIVLDGGKPDALGGARGDSVLGPQMGEGAVVVLNKADLGRVDRAEAGAAGAHVLSLQTGEGLGGLVEMIAGRAATALAGDGEVVPTRARHRAALESCLAALGRAGEEKFPELMAEDLRIAAQALGRITGKVDPEAVLDIIFQEFCIGK